MCSHVVGATERDVGRGATTARNPSEIPTRTRRGRGAACVAHPFIPIEEVTYWENVPSYIAAKLLKSNAGGWPWAAAL